MMIEDSMKDNAKMETEVASYKVNYDGIPKSLKANKGFVNWHFEKRDDGKFAKVPVNEKGKHIDPLDPMNQLDFTEARKIAEEHAFGIGFVISPEKGLVGIDLDHCIDAEGNPDAFANEIILVCDSFTEYSQSGNGIHIWIKDTDIEGITRSRRKGINLEIYRDKRYLTLTGKHFDGTPVDIEERQGMTRVLVEKYLMDEPQVLTTITDNNKHDTTQEKKDIVLIYDNPEDDDVIDRIRRSKQAELFHELFDLGNTALYKGDDSSADMALMDILPFWTKGNPEQMERIFGMSALAARDKWVERKDYRESTINAALRSWDGAYFGDGGHKEQEKQKLELKTTDSGRIIPCAENFERVLMEDEALVGIVAYNEFEYKLVKRNMPPWKSRIGEWSDADDAHLRSYISKKYDGIYNTTMLNDALVVVSRENGFHPVREYLESLEWDGVRRADEVFIKTLKAEDSEYTRGITWFWLKAAVKRIYEPGCKFDYCLVLQGNQGTGKSTILRKLGREWFNDSIDSIENKDALLQLHSGSWIIELGEMQATKKSDNEAIKAFISRTTDKYRAPYGRRTETYPRSCVFAGSTNDTEPLKDKTGGRRFWILESCATAGDTAERLSIITDDYIDQIWAEVYAAYKTENAEGEVSLMPPKEIMDHARELQEQATEGSEFLGQIVAFLETPIPAPAVWDSYDKEMRKRFFQNAIYDATGKHVEGVRLRDTICSAEIATELFHIDNLAKNKALIHDINTVMANLHGWCKISTGNAVWTGRIYGPQRNIYQRQADSNIT